MYTSQSEISHSRMNARRTDSISQALCLSCSKEGRFYSLLRHLW